MMRRKHRAYYVLVYSVPSSAEMANQRYAAIYQAREQQSYKMNSSDLCKSVWLSYLRTLESAVVMRTHIIRKIRSEDCLVVFGCFYIAILE